MSLLIQKQITVPRDYHHQRIDYVLANLLTEYSRSQLSSWIKTGKVTLNHQPCKPKDKALEGDHIEIKLDLSLIDKAFTPYHPQDIPLNIIFEDDNLLVLNKPPNIVVHPGAGNKDRTLVNALLHHDSSLEHLPRAGLIHRLDKDTSGLLVVAKTLGAYTALIRQMQAREIQRHYICLVQGYIISGGIIDTGFGRHSKNRLKMTVQKQGRQAITHYAVKKHYPDYTLLNVKLMTGRTHQIRVHLAYIKHPVVGDPLYGGRMRFPSHASEELRNLLQEFKRQALHASTLAFCHPQSGEQLTFSADLPDDFQHFLQLLDTYNDAV